MVASAMIKQTTGYPMAADDSIMFEISIDHIGGPLLFDQLGRMELTMKELNPQVSAVEALGALAHDTRLSVCCMLVKAVTAGLLEGAIALPAHWSPPTMPHRLGLAERAGLVEHARQAELCLWAGGGM